LLDTALPTRPSMVRVAGEARSGRVDHRGASRRSRGSAPDAVAAVLNVTVVGPAADAFATVFPCGEPVPTASNLNYRAGVDIANAVVTKLGDGVRRASTLRRHPPARRRQRLRPGRRDRRHARPGAAVGHPRSELDGRRSG
jgi:hypothetical protein